MDTLRPKLIWINGKCFRTSRGDSNSQDSVPLEETCDIKSSEFVSEEKLAEDYDVTGIQKLGENLYEVVVSIPKIFHGTVVGKQGTTTKRLQVDTGTQIKIPNKMDKEEGIHIVGPKLRGVASARSQIESMARFARQRLDFTHFLSIPFNHKDIMEAYLEFQDDVFRLCSDSNGLSKDLFQSTQKIHLTIGTLILLNDSDRKKAAKILTEFQEFIKTTLENKPLVVSLKGLDCMNDDPTAVSVLYAKIERDDYYDKLQKIADELNERYIAADLTRKQYDRVKLHVTVMNMQFKKDKANDASYHEYRKPKDTFDASKILKQLGDFNFGRIRLNEIHISALHQSVGNSYYQYTAKIKLPE